MKLIKEEAIEFFGEEMIKKRFNLFEALDVWVGLIAVCTGLAVLLSMVFSPEMRSGSNGFFVVVVLMVGGALIYGKLPIEFNYLVEDCRVSVVRFATNGCHLQNDAGKKLFVTGDSCQAKMDLVFNESSAYILPAFIDNISFTLTVGRDKLAQFEASEINEG